MSLNPDTVDITVGDTTYTLVPNLEAATAVSLNLNGPLAALEGLKGMNILTVTGIIAAGASLPRKEAADLSKKIFESGDMAEISAQCVDFCILLMNGGKREEKKEAAGKKVRGDQKLVTFEEYCERLYELATGWLGWSDKDAMTVPFCRIEHALKGKMDFIVKTNPFGGKKDEEGTTDFDPSELTDERRAEVANDIKTAMRALSGKG